MADDAVPIDHDGGWQGSHAVQLVIDIQNHDLDASLRLVGTRQVSNDDTIRFDRKIYRIPREQVRAGMRGASVPGKLRPAIFAFLMQSLSSRASPEAKGCPYRKALFGDRLRTPGI